MPELPDVEIVRRNLKRWIVGEKISSAETRDAYVSRPGSTRAFAKTLAGRRVESVDRKGKWLRIVLDDGGRLFSHLGMTGDWVRVARAAPAQRFERARIDLEKHGVRYVDARRFGRLIATRKDIDEWKELGPDPLDETFDESVLARSKRAIKETLMDQTVIAGVGNIIATEALWSARIDPRSESRALTSKDVRTLMREVRREIERELTRRDVRFRVYGRAGEKCPRCGTKIESVKLGGRTSAFCPHDQIRRR